MNKKTWIILLSLFIAVTIPLVVYLAQQSQEIRQRAQVYTSCGPNSTPATCINASFGTLCTSPGGELGQCQLGGDPLNPSGCVCKPQCTTASTLACPDAENNTDCIGKLLQGPCTHSGCPANVCGDPTLCGTPGICLADGKDLNGNYRCACSFPGGNPSPPPTPRATPRATPRPTPPPTPRPTPRASPPSSPPASPRPTPQATPRPTPPPTPPPSPLPVSPLPSPRPTPRASPRPTPAPSPGGQCTDIRLYKLTGLITDPAAWHLLTLAEMQTLQPGETVYATVRGSATNGFIPKARIRMNSNTWSSIDQTSDIKPGTTDEFYKAFIIPTGTFNFKFEAEVCIRVEVGGVCTWF